MTNLPEELLNWLREKYRFQLENPDEKLDIKQVLLDIENYNKQK